MTRRLQVEITDATWRRIEAAAREEGADPVHLAAAMLEQGAINYWQGSWKPDPGLERQPKYRLSEEDEHWR